MQTETHGASSSNKLNPQPTAGPKPHVAVPTKNGNTVPSASSYQGIHIHSTVDAPIIRDVWADNFEEEFRQIMHLAEKYRVIGMDTEFPGIVYRIAESDIQNSIIPYNEIEYRTIKMNVDKLKVIQVGLSFADDTGCLPVSHVCTWQFNFKFDLKSDEFAKDAIELLSNSGINFAKHQTHGISPQLFAEYLISSGLVLNDDTKWITFHGGFDFAYLIRMLTGLPLPDDDASFYNILNTYFPCFYDVKHMTKELENLKGGGLSKLASDLSVKRIGPQHQAGSDSLLTLSTFFKLRDVYFKNSNEQKHSNFLYGIGGSVEEYNDYLQNFINIENNYPVMFNGYPYNQLGSLMNGSYFSQPDPFNNMPNHNNYHFVNFVYNNFPPGGPFIENTQKGKKIR
jgi:CCR4-NOT transcription complex subunit 7/8